jgi:hypothetical protein
MIVLTTSSLAQAPKPEPAPKSPPPQVLPPGDTRRDVAFQKARGELVSYDPATRTGTFKKTADGTIARFIALPHVICQHHGSIGDMSDYRMGERLNFILVEGTDGQWNRLNLVAEELEEILSHKEAYFVDRIDTERRILHCTRKKLDGSAVIWPDMVIHTDADTRYWREGRPGGQFSDLAPGMPLYIKTHGGTGLLERVAWEVLMDDASVKHFEDQQIKAHEARLTRDGFPGYADSVNGAEVKVTLFQECSDMIRRIRPLKAKAPVLLAQAGPDRAAVGNRIPATIVSQRLYIRHSAYITEVVLSLESPAPGELKPASLIRLWPGTEKAGVLQGLISVFVKDYQPTEFSTEQGAAVVHVPMPAS